ncbi:hypothetical protein RJT34_12665 [Clitoria ternatea]|uniref:Uncharacterized protein n=1 Tax=Clitoria ternatea TaxID=43366 RepID=A0AAN9PJI7_CLITE
MQCIIHQASIVSPISYLPVLLASFGQTSWYSDLAMAFASPFVPHTFSSSISTKLSKDNYLTWIQHA